HTRLVSDWSSDVCSSDLPEQDTDCGRAEKPMAETLLIVFIICILLGMPISIALGAGALGAATLFPALNPIIIPTRFVGLLSDSRSEERRVGKDCVCRWQQ